MGRRIWLGLAVAVALATAQAGVARAAPPLAAMETVPDIVAPLMPAVVNITVLKVPTQEDPRTAADNSPPSSAQGSGFVIDPTGYIVTNRHVVAGAYSVTVMFNDGTSLPARVLSTNLRPDLALLKVDAAKPLPTVKFGDSDALRIGQPVIAIGNPLGLSSSVSVGVISALNRDIDTTMIDDFIQTDAAINHGNSGGPLFNLKGEVIGVNWALLAPGQQTGSAGLGLALPSNDVAFVIDEMRRFGKFQSGFVGIRVQQVTPDMQDAMNLPSGSGGIVLSVWPGGPADKAGIHEGDVILEVDGNAPHDVRAMLRRFGATAPGSHVWLLMWQHGTLRKITVPVTQWPANSSAYNPTGPQPGDIAGPARVTADMGMRLAATSSAQRTALRLAGDIPAVTVTSVSINSPAADAGLQAGDVILRVQHTRVGSADDVWDEVRRLHKEGHDKVMMLTQSQDVARWVVLPVPPGN